VDQVEGSVSEASDDASISDVAPAENHLAIANLINYGDDSDADDDGVYVDIGDVNWKDPKAVSARLRVEEQKLVDLQEEVRAQKDLIQSVKKLMTAARMIKDDKNSRNQIHRASENVALKVSLKNKRLALANKPVEGECSNTKDSGRRCRKKVLKDQLFCKDCLLESLGFVKKL